MALTTLVGYLVQVNPAFCQTVGYTVEELIGLNFERLVHADDLPAGLALVEQLVRGEITFFQVEKRYIAKDRQIIHVLLHATLRSDAEGQPINLIRQIVDITDQKRVETQLIDSLKEKDILLKETHHRVKNNLQVISSLLALQSHYSAEVYTREMMQESQNRVRSMALVHEQLYQDQDLTNIDCARYLRTLIEHLERAYQPQAGTVNLNIEVAEVLLNIDQAIPCGLIVNELVSNALKHAFPGGQDGQIHVQLRTNEAKTIARLTVADTGVGLPLAIDFKATDSLEGVLKVD
jgi:PAS domain S-box-containing protein